MIEWKRLGMSGCIAVATLVALVTAGCADGTDASSLDASRSDKGGSGGYNAPRIQRTGSLIDEPLIAHTDDDDSNDVQGGAETVPQMLGGVSAIRNTRMSGTGQ